MTIQTSLRSAFSAAKLKHALKIALTAAALAPVIALSTSTAKLNRFELVLASLPKEAIPSDPTKLPQRQAKHYTIDYTSAYNNFKSICPDLNTKTPTETAAWLTQNINNDQLPQTSLKFRDAAYNLVITLPESDEKNALIARLNTILPDSDILTTYLDSKRIELARNLQNDPIIKAASQNWNRMNDPVKKEKILQRVSNITLDTLLPNKKISYPTVVWKSSGMGFGSFGSYPYSGNTIYFNGSLDPSKYTFQFAVDITVHETIHTFQSILVTYGNRGLFKDIADLDRHIRILHSTEIDNAGAIRSRPNDPDNDRNYKLLKNESMAWGFALVGQTIANPDSTSRLSGRLHQDMYTSVDIRQPTARAFHKPLVDTIPQLPARPDTGALITACIK